MPNSVDSDVTYTRACQAPSSSPDSLPGGKLGTLTSVDPLPDTTRACQARKVTLRNSGNMLTDFVCVGKRAKGIRLLSPDRFLGWAASDDAPGKIAIMCGKHRDVYTTHRDVFKRQNDDCWETGIVLQIDSKKVLGCPIHLQLRLDGAQSVSHVELRRAAKADRRESIQSTTSTVSDKSSFGSMSKADAEQRGGDLDSSSSSGLEMPPLRRASADTLSDTTDIEPPTPRFAQAVRHELNILKRSSARSDLVERTNKSSRTPRLSVGSEVSGGNQLSSENEMQVEGNAPSSVAPSEFDFDSLSLNQRSPPNTAPWTTVTKEKVNPSMGCAAKQMRGGQPMGNVLPASNIDELSGVEGLMPQFSRRRSAPSTHQVVTGEVDVEMYDKHDQDVTSSKGLSSWLKGEKDDSKEEPWARLNELATFALCGFGQFSATLGVGVYNNERRTTLLRQGMTDRDRLWDRGIRVPIGNRIAYGEAAMLRGTISPENVGGRTLLVSDFLPLSQEVYVKFQPDGKKNEPRKKQALSVEKWAKAAKQHTEMLCLPHGLEREKERTECILEMERERGRERESP